MGCSMMCHFMHGSYIERHVYGRWQAIVDDKELGIQELICKELNFPHISLSAAEQAGLQGQNGSGSSNPGAQNNQNHGSGITGNNNAFADAGQVNSMFYYRDMQRRLVQFVKKRVLLLEKALNYEYAEEFYGLGSSSSMPSEEPEAEAKVTDTVGVDFIEVNDEMLDGLPKTDPITSEEMIVAAVDNNQEGVEVAQLFNKEDHLESWSGRLVKGCFLLSFEFYLKKISDVDKRQSAGLLDMDKFSPTLWKH
ncbi:unnamed protein product [Arabis nemorensis]|uniref:Uncharacterized protein n=1 Tax=Arabis nemorensis TaxID=586526 RepID=A0A565BLG9_9BRAS|nr:unnamed protein product [Arabis nemorensis]